MDDDTLPRRKISPFAKRHFGMFIVACLILISLASWREAAVYGLFIVAAICIFLIVRFYLSSHVRSVAEGCECA